MRAADRNHESSPHSSPVGHRFRYHTRGQGDEQQHPGEDSGKLTRKRADAQDARETVGQDRDRGEAEESAVNGAGTTEDARAAKDHGSDRRQLVPNPGIGPSLGDTRNEDDGGKRRDDTCLHISERQAALHRETGVTRVFR
jgi:hypothetical protein